MNDELVAWLRAEVQGDLGIARHILDVRGARPDPRREMHDAIADCEAKLAILDDYADTLAIKAECERKLGQGEPLGETGGRDYLDADRELAALKHVVRLLASGYRHRAGYKETWKP